MSPDTPVKRKRGRPPKEGSLSNKITTTMNINVNTSSDLNSPTAEFNSNMMVKRGAPDISTPLMKVSPRPRKKSRKGSSSSISSHSSSEISPGYQQQQQQQFPLQQNYFQTPLSQAINGSIFTPYSQVNLKTLDNISMITNNTLQSSQHQLQQLPMYNTPPSSASIKSQFQTNYWNSPNFLHQTPIMKSNTTNAVNTSSNNVGSGSPNVMFPTPTPSLVRSHTYSGTTPKTNSELSPKSKNNLLPAASITKKEKKMMKQKKEQKLEKSKETPQVQVVADEKIEEQPLIELADSEFILKLMVDDSGKAILSDDMFGIRNEPVSPQFKPRLGHANSVIGIEQYPMDFLPEQPNESSTYNLKRSNSEITAPKVEITSRNDSTATLNSNSSIDLPSSIFAPSTPKLRDNYLLQLSGLTPNINLAYNLTPQFNSMMYSMITLNSPQVIANNNNNNTNNNNNNNNINNINNNNNNKRAINAAQLFTETTKRDTEDGETVNFSDLMNFSSSTTNNTGAKRTILSASSTIKSSAASQPCSASTSSSSSVISSAVSSTFPPLYLQGNMSTGESIHEDSGDARLALRKIIHIKRERN